MLKGFFLALRHRRKILVTWGEALGTRTYEKTASLEPENRIKKVFCEAISGNSVISN
jgi:hypothetical protein